MELFMLSKGLIFILIFAIAIRRYWLTTHQKTTFEIWFLSWSILKVTLFLFGFFTQYITFLYICLIMNSIQTIVLSYMLEQRKCVCYDQPISRMRWNQAILATKILIYLALIFALQFDSRGIYYWRFHCDTDTIYRK